MSPLRLASSPAAIARWPWLVCVGVLASAACRTVAPSAATPPPPPAPTSTRPPLASPSPLLSPSALPSASPLAAPVWVGSVTRDAARAAAIQQEVDQGHTPWRLDPVAVAREDGQQLGFDASDRFELVGQASGPAGSGAQATVRAVHAGQTYEVQLTQPAKAGAGGIWTIGEVRRGN